MEKSILNYLAYQYLYEDASVIFLVLDEDGTILDANQYTKKLTGLDFSDNSLNLFNILVDFGNLAPFQEIKEQQAPQMFHVNTYNSLPQTFYFKFYEKAGHTLAFGHLNYEELESLQMNLVEANNDANNLSRELQKKNVQLDQLNKIKNQFLGMAAHDLRNPIGIILEFSKFLIQETQGVLTDEQQKLLQNIETSSQFMLHLLNDLLDVAKIESGKLELEFAPTDFNALVKRIVALNQIVASQKNIQIYLQIYEKLPKPVVDSIKMEQVLNNLLTNAIKFSPANSRIDMSVFQSGNDVMVSVKDQGPGIPENERSKLFQPFQTTSVKSTGGEKSTGLGLMIVKKIITGHQGQIWVESTEGSGSTFFFTIPIFWQEWQKRSKIKPKKESVPQIDFNLAQKIPLNLLVVDDQSEQIDLFTILLKQLGYTAETAQNVHQALEKMSQIPFHIVFLDLNLPDIDGITMARHLMRNYPHDKLPYLIAVTGFSITKEECLAVGMKDYLPKPVMLEHLQSQIEKYGKSIPKHIIKHERFINKTLVPTPDSPDTFLNLEVLEDLRIVDPEFLMTLMDLFLDQTPELIKNLRTAVDQGSMEVTYLIDQIRGASAHIGARKLEHICQLTEDRFNQNDAVGLAANLYQMGMVFEQTKQVLQQLMSKEKNLSNE